MRVQAKICGLSTPETVDAAIAAGAAYAGFVFVANSPRNIAPDAAVALADRCRGRAKTVAVVVNPPLDLLDTIFAARKLDIIQLHGNEPPPFAAMVRKRYGVPVWKAIAVRTRADLDVARQFRGVSDRILYDAKPPQGSTAAGGHGVRFDWHLLDGFAHPCPWALSGGLNVENIAEAAAVTGARLVDVSSGVETAPGVKDVDKITAFLQACATL